MSLENEVFKGGKFLFDGTLGWEKVLKKPPFVQDLKIEEEIKKRFPYKPNERLGQHFLVDGGSLEEVVSEVINGANVIEIGAGPGNLTERVAKKAQKVFAIEVDSRFKEILCEIAEKEKNIEVIIGDAQRIDLVNMIREEPDGVWQIVSNLPFHIFEPIMKKLVVLPVENFVLLVGSNQARIMDERDVSSLGFSKMSLLVNTFFCQVDRKKVIDKRNFFPVPRVDAELVVLTPREEAGRSISVRLKVLRRLFEREQTNQTVRKTIKDVFSEGDLGSRLKEKGKRKKENRRAVRRKDKEALRLLTLEYKKGLASIDDNLSEKEASIQSRIERLGLSNAILDAPFNQLDNQKLRLLDQALRNL